jgi:type I restriction enzyme S subunit
MAVTSVVQHSALENFLDWSPEYYRPAFLSMSDVVRGWKVNKIRHLAYVTDGEHGSPDWDEFSGILYVAAEYIRPNEILDAPMRSISLRQDQRNERCRLQEGDVLVYSVGAYAGYAACAESHLFPASIPRSVAIVRLRDRANLMPGFLSVFLNSKYGLFQSYRFRAGNSQPVLALEKIQQYEIPLVPMDFQKQMQTLYDDAYKARLDAKLFYNQAQQILEAELGLDKLRFDKPLGYTARFSELELSHRTDAQHFQPHIAQLLEHLAKFPHKRIRDLRRYNRRGIQPVYAEDGTHAVVNSQHLGPKHINYGGLQKTTEQAFNASPVAHIKPDDLLIYTTGAYIEEPMFTWTMLPPSLAITSTFSDCCRRSIMLTWPWCFSPS